MPELHLHGPEGQSRCEHDSKPPSRKGGVVSTELYYWSNASNHLTTFLSKVFTGQDESTHITRRDNQLNSE